jgi:hypothetical protein
VGACAPPPPPPRRRGRCPRARQRGAAPPAPWPRRRCRRGRGRAAQEQQEAEEERRPAQRHSTPELSPGVNHTRPPTLSSLRSAAPQHGRVVATAAARWCVIDYHRPPGPAPPWRWAAATLRCPGAPTCTAAVSRCAVGRPWTATSSVCSAVETSATVDACASPPPTGVRSSSTSCEAGGDSQSHEMTTGRGGHPGHSHSR